VRGAVAVRGLQRVADVAARGEEQALFLHRCTADVATQPFEFLALIGLDRDAGVQRKAGHVAGHLGRPLLPATVRESLQREYLAPPVRAQGNSVDDGMPARSDIGSSSSTASPRSSCSVSRSSNPSRSSSRPTRRAMVWASCVSCAKVGSRAHWKRRRVSSGVVS